MLFSLEFAMNMQVYQLYFYFIQLFQNVFTVVLNLVIGAITCIIMLTVLWVGQTCIQCHTCL